MNVGELRRAISSYEDRMPVVVRFEESDEEFEDISVEWGADEDNVEGVGIALVIV